MHTGIGRGNVSRNKVIFSIVFQVFFVVGLGLEKQLFEKKKVLFCIPSEKVSFVDSQTSRMREVSISTRRLFWRSVCYTFNSMKICVPKNVIRVRRLDWLDEYFIHFKIAFSSDMLDDAKFVRTLRFWFNPNLWNNKNCSVFRISKISTDDKKRVTLYVCIFLTHISKSGCSVHKKKRSFIGAIYIFIYFLRRFKHSIQQI